MARAASKKLTTKPKTIRPKLPRSTMKTLDDKYYGSEPLDVSVKGLVHALNWYNYMYESDEVRPWLFDYLKKEGYTRADVAAIRRLPKYKIPKTLCSMSRILLNGNVLPEENMQYITGTINDLIAAGRLLKDETVDQDTEDKPVISIQDRVRAKNDQLLTDCEEALDADPLLNIYEWLKSKEATAQAATKICDYYSKWIKDFEVNDKLASREDKKRNAAQLKYWTQFVYDCERFIGNKKVTKVRKPRERKQKSAVDQVKSLKYQKEFPPLKIVSVNPAEIVGCKQLWTYNTKTKKLTRYDASGPNGIQVKGTTLTGFDVELSLTKSVRKPDGTIQSLLGAGKVALRKVMDDLKTNETKPTGRINTDTVLLRVIK